MVTVLQVDYGVNFWAVGSLPLGVGLDLILGHFARKPGPGFAIGRLVELAERGLRVAVVRRGGTSKAELLAGLVLAVVVVGLVGGLVWLAVELLNQLGGPATLIGRAVLIAAGLSFGRLGSEVLRASEAVDLATARRTASNFVGLESTRLDQAGIRKACVESVGNRANRLVIGPLFWLAIGGPAGLWAYQSIETLGGLVVDRGPRSRFFGFASARLFDLANFIPARLTWLLITLSAGLMGEDAGEAFRSGLAQGRQHPERPGSWGMATLAGALGLQLGGRYANDPVEASTVRRAVWIMQVAGLHALALAIAFRIVILGG